jgi:putative addiction module component (TIGR02574 family)
MASLTRDDIVRLSPQERIELIGELWDSIGDGELPLPQAQASELGRRLASFDRDRPQAVSWDELKADLAARAP